jgi:hypothetical protein
MKKVEKRWQILMRLVLYTLVLVIVMALPTGIILSNASGSGDGQPAWAAPGAMAVRRASAVDSAQNQPNFLDNLDCNLVTYRIVATSTMQTGCFTETAFGLFDSDSETVIFNGTDEGLALLPYSTHQVLAPWPKALDLVQFNPLNTGGAYISLYKNPLAVMQNQRNILGQLTAKQMTAGAELSLNDPAGNKLVVNPETMAFSDGGSWLVIETLNGSFVRINLATLEVTAFAPSYYVESSQASLKSVVAVSDDGRFVAIGNEAAQVFKVYDLGTCSGTAVNLQPQNCQSYDYRPFVSRQISGLQSVRHIRFISRGLLSFEAVTSNPANDGIYELAPQASITSLTDYLGVGDSYTSGEGAFDYLADTDSPANMCHLSRHSYPLLLTQDLFSSIGGHSVACSGAVINDVGSTSDSYRGQVSGVASWQQLEQTNPLLLESIQTNFAPGYIAQQRFVQRWQPRIATVSVGGDDIGFGDLLQNCVEPHVSKHLSDSTCYNTYEDRLELTQLIDRTVPRLTGLYKQLRHESPATQLYVIGYPQIFADTGTCALNVQLNKSELEFSIDLISYLNQDIRKAATAANVTYVDISQALAGHRLCETASYNTALNGLTAGTDGGPLGLRIFGKESYHPNALGQELIEQAILKQTHNLSAATPGSDSGGSTTANPPLLNAPKTGRQINTRIPDDSLTTAVGKRGTALGIQVSGARDGLKPQTVYTIRLDGPQGTVIGTVMSNSAGDIDTGVTIPADTTPGGHSIDIGGGNQAGDPVDVTQPIYVPASDTDSDGDGIPDSTDSCPGAINSGQDTDQDGLDDVCDNLIGPAPIPPATTTGATGSSTGTGPGGETGSETVVTDFDTDETVLTTSSETTLAASSNSTSGTAAHLLGATTANPTLITRSAFKSVAKSGLHAGAQATLPLQVLRSIPWLFWTIVLLTVLSTLLLIEKYTNAADFKLQ